MIPFRIDPNGKEEYCEDVTDINIRGLKLLLAEDNELNMEIAQTIPEDAGASVVPAKNGQEAVNNFEDSELGTYDAIILDVMMPVMDGLTAAKTIRAMERSDAKTVPIIAMTANAFKEDAEKCLAAGMNAHLAKPLDVSTLEKTIRKLVASRCAAAHK